MNAQPTAGSHHIPENAIEGFNSPKYSASLGKTSGMETQYFKLSSATCAYLDSLLLKMEVL